MWCCLTILNSLYPGRHDIATPVELQILQARTTRMAMQLSGQIPKERHMHMQDKTSFGKPLQKNFSNPTLAQLRTLRADMMLFDTVMKGYAEYGGFYLGSKQVRKSCSIQGEDKRGAESQRFIMQLNFVAKIKLEDGGEELWARVRQFTNQGFDPISLCPLLKAGQLSWLPLEDEQVHLAKMVMVVPYSTSKKYFCHNIWIAKEVTASKGL